MDTWWIDQPFLLGSSNPTDADLDRLQREGFRVIICLLDETKEPPRYEPARARALGYMRHSIPVRDFRAPSIAQLEEFVDLVQAAGVQTRSVVHCEGGSGRTGTMAAAYWIAKGLSRSEAIKKIRSARPDAVETDDQRAALGEYETKLLASR